MSTTYPSLPYTTFPDSIQSFPLMTNIIASDGANVKLFQEAMQAGNTQLAQEYYNRIANADSKFVDAEKLNKLFQTCQALEQFYSTDVQPYIEQKQIEWQNIIDKFDYKGVYTSGTQYQVDNWVSYTTQGMNQLYICVQTPPVGTAPTNTTYWRALTVQGLTGPSGDGMTFTGEWDASHSYSVQDVVIFENGLWGCAQANVNNEPYEGSPYWNLIYRVVPPIYPVQMNQPATANTGDLWFEVLE